MSGATPSLAIRLGPLELDNPVMPASGCFMASRNSRWRLSR